PLPPLVTSTSEIIYDPGVFAPNTTYCWRVVAKNSFGEAVGCAESSFTTSGDLFYCPSVPTSMDNSGITNLVVESTSFPISAITYTDLTGQGAVPIVRGAALNYQVTFATGYSYNSNVWIDYNDDGDFNDPGELVGSAESLSTNPTTLTIPISISGAAPLGVHRMRLGTADSGQLTPNPCYGSTY